VAQKVLLRRDMDGLGNRGDIVEVADGYARNFLLPYGCGVQATPGVAAQALAMRRARDLAYAKDREDAEAVARRLVPLVFTVPARAGKNGRLFGSVTSQDVAEAIFAETGIELDRRRLVVTEPIRNTGEHTLQAKLHSEVEFQVTIDVVAI
jgi:large subunit ribosomal protein L9